VGGEGGRRGGGGSVGGQGPQGGEGGASKSSKKWAGKGRRGRGKTTSVLERLAKTRRPENKRYEKDVEHGVVLKKRRPHRGILSEEGASA